MTLFRIFNYPAAVAADGDAWGVGEHTDYGLLTMLRQDANAGLRGPLAPGRRLDPRPADPRARSCATSATCSTGSPAAYYRSTPHRVVASAARDRLSWPFFFDPSWDADVRPVGQGALADAAQAAGAESSSRWDGVDLTGVTGTYGEYLLGKVGKVFPDLLREVL